MSRLRGHTVAMLVPTLCLLGCAIDDGNPAVREASTIPIWAERLTDDSPPVGGERPALHYSVRSVVADWNDLDASIDLGAAQSQMAVLRADSPDSQRRRWKLKTVDDRAVWLEATTLGHETSSPPAPSSPEAAPHRIRLRCYAGPFGDQAAESRLLNNTAHRLEDLAGVATFPIRE